MRKKWKKYTKIYTKSKKILIVLVWLFFKKHCHKRVFPDFIHKTREKKKGKKTHSNMNLCCIEWFQYNLEIWSKKGTWHTLDTSSELWMMLPRKRESVGPGLSLFCPVQHLRSTILAAAGQGWPHSWQTLLFAFHDGNPKLQFQHPETCCVLFRESKMLELNQLLTAD